MQRQLKFRAWDKLAKQFTYPDKGYQGHYVLTLNGQFQNFQNGSGGEEYVVQQFTGLKDKNGKEIYEGDIIERKALTKTENHSYNYCHCYEVIYSTDEASYILKYGSGDDYVYLSDFIDNLEIIGNTFENSELLKNE